MAADWPRDAAGVEESLSSWADGVLIGPGLGNTPASRALVESILTGFSGPVLLDADALNVFAGDAPSLGKLLRGRPALLTPHPGEAARLAGIQVEEVLERRFTLGAELASITGAGVLLKGVPTVVTAPDGAGMVSATGSAVLATAGSGDVLSGIAATLLCQSGDPLLAGSCAAWVHGRAGELADSSDTIRGTDLEDVLRALGMAWRAWPPQPEPPVLAVLPAAGARN
jgi:NAD(P)H-hydrate epimerase